MGKALGKIEKNHKIHGSLKAACEKLYTYTNNEGGIRHSFFEGDGKVTMYEAQYMLVSCSAMVNYLLGLNNVKK